MKSILRFWFLSLICVLSIRCGGDAAETPDPNTDPPTPPVTEDKITFPDDLPAPVFSCEAGETTVAFTASGSWTARVTDSSRAAIDWLTVVPGSGEAGTACLTVTARPNDQAEERSGVIVIRCGTNSAQIAVTQHPSPVASAEAEIRARLVQLYRDTDGDNWTRNDNWCSDKPISEWYGVTYKDGRLSLDFSGDLINDNKNIYSGNNLCGEIDLSGCTALVEMLCHFNRLSSLNVSGCVALYQLLCYENQLIYLNVSGCTGLVSLSCAENQLTNLDIADNSNLLFLLCNNNQLLSLDVSGCPALNHLSCHFNQLTTLDISGCQKLTNMYCNDNKLTDLNISGCELLEQSDISSNRLRSFKLSGYKYLEMLLCNNNDLRTLSINDCPILEYLRCEKNKLETLNITQEDCPRLEYLSCGDNRIDRQVPQWFRQLAFFIHDAKYVYSYVWDVDHWVYTWEKRDYGWWYEGEPLQGYHDWPK